MFDRFTDRARKVMGLSRQEAQRFNHGYIGVEHVLLGLIQEGHGVATDVLKNLDVDPKRVRMEVEKLLVPGEAMATTGQLPFTPRARRMLELALEEASNLGHNCIGTEHLLLGLIREREGIAAQVLENHVRLQDVREQVLELLGAAPSQPDDEGLQTLRAKLAMDRASLIARHFRHESIGTEHILLGLIDEAAAETDPLSRLLLHRLRDETEKLLTPGDTAIGSTPVSLAPDAMAATALAFEAAGQSKVDVGHLLLGLLREKGGIAARVLAAAGIREEDAIAALHPSPGGATGSLDVVRKVVGGERSASRGAGLFPRFADRTRAFSCARQEAQRLNHDYIGTEHILLGLIAAGGGAAEILRKLGIHPNRIREQTEKLVAPGDTMVTMGQLPFTPSAKRALELTLEETNALRHDEIREEHLLLGLLREEKGTAARVLASLGLDPETVRKAIGGPPTPPE